MTVYLLDLTGAQVAAIEEAVDMPIEQWQKAYKGELYPVILHVALGGELAEYEAMPIGELVKMVEMDSPGKA